MRSMILALALAVFLPPVAVSAKDATTAAINRAKSLATKSLPAVPQPVAPRDVYVPARRLWLPQVGAFVTVPGHWERRISDTQSSVPPLTIPREGDRPTLVIPSRERPPAEIRTGP